MFSFPLVKAIASPHFTTIDYKELKRERWGGGRRYTLSNFNSKKHILEKTHNSENNGIFSSYINFSRALSPAVATLYQQWSKK